MEFVWSHYISTSRQKEALGKYSFVWL